MLRHLRRREDHLKKGVAPEMIKVDAWECEYEKGKQ
jgi:hypothetical protein